MRTEGIIGELYCGYTAFKLLLLEDRLSTYFTIKLARIAWTQIMQITSK